MIIGTGIDIVNIERIEKALLRYGDKFTQKIFTDRETAYCSGKKNMAVHFAARFAAKEAFLKALGTGVSEGISLKDIETVRETGAPEIILHGAGKTKSSDLGLKKIHLSISHDAGIAVASVVIEG